MAWDAVQKTLVRIWDRGWLPDEPEAALVHLVVKSSLHQLRCQRRRTFHEAEGSRDTGLCCDEDPLAVLESAEQRQIVRDAVRELSEEYRAVIEMYAFDGDSYETIAGRLDLPIGTVRSRLSRGRAVLRERLLARISAA